jgi:hypothetical protein
MSFSTDDNGGLRTKPIPSSSNLVHLSEVRERQDNGRRLAVLETPDAELFAARERADLAADLVMPRSLSITTAQSPSEAVGDIGRELDDALSKLRAAAKVADDSGLSGVHMRLLGILLEVDSLASGLAGGEAA